MAYYHLLCNDQLAPPSISVIGHATRLTQKQGYRDSDSESESVTPGTLASPIVLMAFAPPANNAGVPIPAIPANPPTLSDITNSKDYVVRLIQSKGKLSVLSLMNETN